MQIIQSLECIELTISAADKTTYFPKDLLKNKNVTALYLFSTSIGTSFRSPFTDTELVYINPAGDLAIFFNFYDTDGNLFLQKIDYGLINKTPSGNSPTFPIPLNRNIDWEKSNLEWKGTLLADFKIVVYIAYNDTAIEDFTDEINGCLRVSLPFDMNLDNKDYQLSKVFPPEIETHKIKKIIVSPYLHGYFDLITNKGQVKNIATPFLQVRSRKEFFFDNLIIDLEKSYFRNRGNSTSNYVTFIW